MLIEILYILISFVIIIKLLYHLYNKNYNLKNELTKKKYLYYLIGIFNFIILLLFIILPLSNNFTFEQFGGSNLSNNIKNKLKKSQNNSIECLSAFNGLAIFKTDRYKGIKYDGLYSNIKKLITDKEREYTIKFLQKNLNGLDNLKLNNEIDCCEHIYYNLLARKQNNCIIKISKFIV